MGLHVDCREGEIVHIGDGITVEVVKNGHGNLKLNIDAPCDVRIVRQSWLDKHPGEALPLYCESTATI